MSPRPVDRVTQRLQRLDTHRLDGLQGHNGITPGMLTFDRVDIDAFEPGGQFAPFDTLPTWDYLALAKGFGAEGFKVSTRAGLEQLLPQLLQIKDRPALIQVVIPRQDLAPQIKRLAKPDGPSFVAEPLKILVSGEKNVPDFEPDPAPR